MTDHKVTIREAMESDLPGVLYVYAQPELDNGHMLPLDEFRSLWQRLKAYPHYKLYIAQIGDLVVGTFALLIMDKLAHGGRPSGIVEDVGVLPEYQGQGIGKRMMNFARDVCAQSGCYKLMLSSNLRRSASHDFYESLGFRRHGYSFLLELNDA